MLDNDFNYKAVIDFDFLTLNPFQMLDADVFLTNPGTLKRLVEKDRHVIAPMLLTDGLYSNFW